MNLKQEIKNAQILLRNWLIDDCLPLWATKGLDLNNGGFFEQLNQDTSPNDINRRTRVAARQIYSFALARKMGFHGPVGDIIKHSFDYLHDKCLAPNDYLYAVLAPNGDIVRADFDLYDHAFYLLGLASAYSDNNQNHEYKARAETMREKIIKDYWRAQTGFEEAIPAVLPLKANPHMHMFEACLAWIEAGGDEKWRELANAIANLAREKFFDRTNNAVLEYFDNNWQPIEKIGERTIEPGHQFEWAWLFLRWSKIANDAGFIEIAKSLIDTGEMRGVDKKRGLAFMSHTDANKPIDFSARLWSQTERIKAYAELYSVQTSESLKTHSIEMVQKAVEGLSLYLNTPVKGLYYDRIDENGAVRPDPSPTSSLYHIICAIDEFCKLDL